MKFFVSCVVGFFNINFVYCFNICCVGNVFVLLVFVGCFFLEFFVGLVLCFLLCFVGCCRCRGWYFCLFIVVGYWWLCVVCVGYRCDWVDCVRRLGLVVVVSFGFVIFVAFVDGRNCVYVSVC